jgi:hypothetical protein
LEKREEQVLLGSKEDGGKEKWKGAWGRNGPNDLFIYE